MSTPTHLTTKQAAERLGKPTANAFRVWLWRQRQRENKYALQLRTYHIGGLNCYRTTDIDRLVESGSVRGAA